MAAQLAVLQMNSSDKVEGNLIQAEKLIQQAAYRGAKVIVLPECFASYAGKDTLQIAKQESDSNGPIRQLLARLAAQHKVWLIGGSIPFLPKENSADRRAFSACFVYNDKGKELGQYSKIHLFDVTVSDSKGQYQESKEYMSGSHLLIVDTPIGRLAPLICYDLRFPELFRALINYGVEIICLPSAFTAVTGAAHWDVLMRARAIENFCYMAGADQAGIHADGRETFGHSMIVDPWGKVIAAAETDQPEVIMAEVDLNRLHQLRGRMPSLKHRQDQLLRNIKVYHYS
ncbi:carbon-nitrogen hydrolase family protein [Endozoicomonas sp. SM1973]|uniref:Carbon-nitrogen hydrolase family protein n=1 Tax=Spartinivicinus marinus TaxID=2994442 RepID=A0A853IGY3_9GAMM|nr:carbon-nitrogen hydrolase family protein [Spartinivicinus marinus]MCX4028206.1 carbon-nitrogen hydrolase family protein [Spartinivicinus marinus]NYZ68405.1 carbon-nitrogen hydrolase family protein [Spartinivicinus marinus]